MGREVRGDWGGGGGGGGDGEREREREGGRGGREGQVGCLCT